MNALILEDNIEQLTRLANIIQTNFPSIHVLKATNYNGAYYLAKHENIHLFLLDIQLDPVHSDALTGIDFGYILRSSDTYHYTPIIYVTSIANQMECALNTLHCQNYILKPYSNDEILSAIRYLLQSTYADSESLRVMDHTGIYHRISKQNILFIEANGKEMNIHHNEFGDATCVTTNKYRLNDFKNELSESFVQCHRKYIINKKHICSYDKCNALLQIETYSIPVGRKYQPIVDHLFEQPYSGINT